MILFQLTCGLRHKSGDGLQKQRHIERFGKEVVTGRERLYPAPQRMAYRPGRRRPVVRCVTVMTVWMPPRT